MSILNFYPIIMTYQCMIYLFFRTWWKWASIPSSTADFVEKKKKKKILLQTPPKPFTGSSKNLALVIYKSRWQKVIKIFLLDQTVLI